tara:strand:- start:1253 stop:1738 length:486 start_codon:yes stop_codon:yes gene_type:complete
MKKIFSTSTLLILSFFIISCSGYKPIFNSSNIKFEIIDFEIEGDSKLGKIIYSKFKNLSKQNIQQENSREIRMFINITKDKKATTKNSAGKVLEYKVVLNTKIVIRDFVGNNLLLKQDLSSSSSYKVQDQYFETVKLEQKAMDTLIEKTYQDILVKLSQTI